MSKYNFKQEEIVLDPKKYIVSKTDLSGVITYGNDYFVEISKYDKLDLIGSPHSVLRHPDMPRVIFKLMWERIQRGENIIAIVKNLAKDGRYYWVMTDFEVNMDPFVNKPLSYTAYRKAAARAAIEAIEPIYKELLEIEKIDGIRGSEEYLRKFLQSRGQTYDQFVDDITKNRGITKLFFIAMKKLFKK